MRLIHLQIQLIFEYEFHSYSVSEQLYKELTGRTPLIVEHLEEPGVVIRSNKRKELVAWDKDSCSVVIESELAPSKCFGRMVTLLESVNKIAPIGDLSERRLITHWLLPSNRYNFKSLERRYRETMMIQQPIWGKTVDSSVILDTRIGNLTLHHQSGPMKPKQLREDFAIFRLDNIPNSFLFLWVSIHSKKMIKYSPTDIRDFMNSSFEYCEHHSKLFENIWGEMI